MGKSWKLVVELYDALCLFEALFRARDWLCIYSYFYLIYEVTTVSVLHDLQCD